MARCRRGAAPVGTTGRVDRPRGGGRGGPRRVTARRCSCSARRASARPAWSGRFSPGWATAPGCCRGPARICSHHARSDRCGMRRGRRRVRWPRRCAHRPIPTSFSQRSATSSPSRRRRPSSWSRTRTGPTARRWTCCAISAGGSAICQACCCSPTATTISVPDHPLRGVLGGFGGATLRLRLAPLTTKAVNELAAPTTMDAAELVRLTGGNPFFVTEALASPESDVPPTVVDAVLARVRRLSAPAQTAIEQLAVVPAGVEFGLLACAGRGPRPDRRGRTRRCAEDARRRGGVPARAGAARGGRSRCRPVSGWSSTRAYSRVLLAQADADPFRILHHAVEASDDEAP